MSAAFINSQRHIKITNGNQQYRLRKDGVSLLADGDNDEISIWFNTELITVVAYIEVAQPSSNDLDDLVEILGLWLDDEVSYKVLVGHLEGEQFVNNTTVNSFEDWLWVAYRENYNNNNFEALWPDNTDNFTFLDSAQNLKVDSTSNNDDVGDSGIQKLIINGLDSNYNSISEILDLNGTSDVTTSNQYLRINKVRVAENVNGSVAADGDIKIRTSGGDLVSKIESDESESMVGLYTVPNNKTLILKHVFITGGDANNAHRRCGFIKICQKLENERVPTILNYSMVFGLENLTFHDPLIITEKTDLYLMANRKANNGSIDYAVTLRGYLINKS